MSSTPVIKVRNFDRMIMSRIVGQCNWVNIHIHIRGMEGIKLCIP